MSSANATSLEEHRAQFSRSPFLAMPIAGTIAWTAIGIAGLLLPTELAAWALFISTALISLGLLVALHGRRPDRSPPALKSIRRARPDPTPCRSRSASWRDPRPLAPSGN